MVGGGNMEFHHSDSQREVCCGRRSKNSGKLLAGCIFHQLAIVIRFGLIIS